MHVQTERDGGFLPRQEQVEGPADAEQDGRAEHAPAREHLTETAGRIEELTGLRPDASGSLLVHGRCAPCAA
ncbi:hypothetical protein [Streptomyces sp. NPDC088254]|uniref:hypothetical protein n=1 Tax=Streptomyces sp. NPDC088254 TaxID=3365847 RepID=UPI0038219327